MMYSLLCIFFNDISAFFRESGKGTMWHAVGADVLPRSLFFFQFSIVENIANIYFFL